MKCFEVALGLWLSSGIGDMSTGPLTVVNVHKLLCIAHGQMPKKCNIMVLVMSETRDCLTSRGSHLQQLFESHEPVREGRTIPM